MVDRIEEAVKAYELNKLTMTHCHIKNLTMVWACPRYFPQTQEFNAKIYVSATILNSADIFYVAIPWLLSNKIAFKVVASNILLKKINDNMFGYLHTGKFITIYSINQEEFINSVYTLNILLNSYKSAPIPLVKCFEEGSIVYFEPDNLSFSQSYPSKETGENTQYNTCKIQEKYKSLLLNKYIVIETIRQRARGGTYLALEVGQPNSPCKKVVIKEARDFGEVEWSGIDAVTRLHWQFNMLERLHKLKITPQPYQIAKQKHSTFLTMEYLPGLCLREKIHKTTAFSLAVINNILMNTANHIQKLHDNNIYFLELCPDNIMLPIKGGLKLIDCDLCYTRGAPEFVEWNSGTPGFFPHLNVLRRTGLNESKWFCLRDIYALGSILFSLLFPSWYKELFLGVPARQSQQLRFTLINSLPKELQDLLKKSMLLREPFSSINEFINCAAWAMSQAKLKRFSPLFTENHNLKENEHKY